MWTGLDVVPRLDGEYISEMFSFHGNVKSRIELPNPLRKKNTSHCHTKGTWLSPTQCYSTAGWQDKRHSYSFKPRVSQKNKAYSWSFWRQAHYTSSCHYRSSSSRHLFWSSSTCQASILCLENWWLIHHHHLKRGRGKGGEGCYQCT